jgi:hypothetical protein
MHTITTPKPLLDLYMNPDYDTEFIQYRLAIGLPRLAWELDDEWNGELYGGLEPAERDAELADCAQADVKLKKIDEDKLLCKLQGVRTPELLPLVKIMRQESLAATASYGVEDVAVLCVLRDYKTPKAEEFEKVLVSRWNLSELLATLWFWDKAKKRPFRLVTKDREYLHRVITDADWGDVTLKAKLKDGTTDNHNYCDNNLILREFTQSGSNRPLRPGERKRHTRFIEQTFVNFSELPAEDSDESPEEAIERLALGKDMWEE